MPFFPTTGYGNLEGLSRCVERGVSILALDWDMGHFITGGKMAIESAKKSINKLRN
jgi:hypothetical protein